MTLDELYRRAGIARPGAGSLTRPLDSFGQNPYSSQSGFGTTLADDQRRNEFAPLIAAQASFNPVNAFMSNPAVGAFAPVGAANYRQPGPAGFNPALSRATGPNATGNPFETLSNTKDPGIQGILQSVLARIGGLNPDPSANTMSVKTNVKSQPVAGAIGNALNQYSADVNNHNQSIADFTKSFLDAQPGAVSTAQREGGSINNWYNGVTEAALARNADQQNQDLYRSVTSPNVEAAIRRAKIGSYSGAPDSYREQILAQEVSQAMAQGALANSQLRRQNLLTVAQAQPAYAGIQQKLMDDAYRRMLFPTQAGQQIRANDINQLGALSGLENQNNFYTLDSPENQLARELGLIGQATSVSNQNNLFGVRKPLEPDASGFLPVRNQSSPNAYFPDYSPLGSGQDAYQSSPSLPARGSRSPGISQQELQYLLSGGYAQPRSNSPGQGSDLNNFLQPMPNVAGSQLSNGWLGTPEVRQARGQAYQDQSGRWPYTEDQSTFSPELWQWVMGNM